MHIRGDLQDRLIFVRVGKSIICNNKFILNDWGIVENCYHQTVDSHKFTMGKCGSKDFHSYAKGVRISMSATPSYNPSSSSKTTHIELLDLHLTLSVKKIEWVWQVHGFNLNLSLCPQRREDWQRMRQELICLCCVSMVILAYIWTMESQLLNWVIAPHFRGNLEECLGFETTSLSNIKKGIIIILCWDGLEYYLETYTCSADYNRIITRESYLQVHLIFGDHSRV